MAIVKILQIEHADNVFTLINKLDGNPVTMHISGKGHDNPVVTKLSDHEVIAVRDMFNFRLERIL